MKHWLASIDTKVARRLLVLFVLCGLLPVVAALALSYRHVGGSLIEERLRNLAKIAQHQEATLLERLDLLAQMLLAVEAKDAGAADHARFAQYFEALAVGGSGRVPAFLLGEPRALPPLPPTGAQTERADRATADAVTLALVRAEGASATIWLIRGVESEEADRTVILAAVNPRFLWTRAEDMPYLARVCVVDPWHEPFNCSEPMPPTAVLAGTERLRAGVSGRFAWSDDDVQHIGHAREVFLRPRFGTESWSILVSQPESHALAPTRDVAWFVALSILLGVVLSAWLASAQIRRTLGPLKHLSDATREISRGNLDVRVPAPGADEIGSLAVSFNTMADHLARQFQLLEALSRIDEATLARVDLVQVVALALSSIHRLGRSEWQSLALASDDVQGRFLVYAFDGTHAVGPTEASPDRRLIEELARTAGGLHLRPADAGHGRAAALFDCAAGGVFVLPILSAGELVGAIGVGTRRAQVIGPDEVVHLQSLGDRIAVARRAAARDLALHRSANYDPLTQLPNRRLIVEKLGAEILRAKEENKALALLFVDLDGFSQVNDTFGHPTGDALLVQVAERLRRCVGESGIVGRMGGDEFTVILRDLDDRRQAASIARHVIESLSRVYDVGHGDTFIAASVGISLHPDDAGSAQQLLRHADLAMYQSKRNGRASYAFFEREMTRRAEQRMTLERELRQGLDAGQFIVHYQPQLDFAANRIVGAEALIRWMHPVRGLVSPADFIPIAEETGLIERLGERVLQTACTQFVAWKAQGLPIDHISVNVSPRQFRQRNLAGRIAWALRNVGMSPRALHLEITESVLVDDSGAVEETLARLRELGVVLELDDFGTGYSSLAYLQRLPVGAIKLDRSFVRDIDRSEQARAVARSVIQMVHALNKQIVAEGVETAEQAALLRAWRCDAMQGFLIGKPAPPADFAALVRAHLDDATRSFHDRRPLVA